MVFWSLRQNVIWAVLIYDGFQTQDFIFLRVISFPGVHGIPQHILMLVHKKLKILFEFLCRVPASWRKDATDQSESFFPISTT